MHVSSHRERVRARRTSRFVALAMSLGCLAAAPAIAQTSSPEIIAKERRDPASGEVVIINRKKKKKAAAPNPYAPGARETAKPDKPATRINKPARIVAPPPRPANRQYGAIRPPGSPPPLPQLHRRPPNETARLRQFPQSDLGDARRERFETGRRYVEPRARPRRRSYRQRYSARPRPWRQCRFLARRCQAGYEGSCYIWQRRCT